MTPSGSGTGRGRFAPSPTGPLHLGNLRTALLGWLFARQSGDRFSIRMEDLDPAVARREVGHAQLHDLAQLGLDHDGPVVWQSDRIERYREAVERLERDGRTFRCWCSRAEIQTAASAPNNAVLPGAYPGTCRRLDPHEIAERERSGRQPAIRLRSDITEATFIDEVVGPVTAAVDDLVLVRNDGVPAYNLAVVVDDADMGVTLVVRGDDLAPSTPRQMHLARLLDLPAPRYAHVPLVIGPDGQRLAKRHGAVTLADLAAHGITPARVLSILAESLALAAPGEAISDPALLVDRFDPARLPRVPWAIDPSIW